MTHSAVRVLVTGGTLDKVHDWRSETLAFDPNGATVLPEILAQARAFDAPVQTVFLKDSLEMTDADRTMIADAARAAPEARIVVTHGTSTMDATAAHLAAAALGKTVVLTGSMRPHSLGRSDASFNLGGALVAAQLLGPGVYAVMNGRVFEAGAIVKNVEAGRFDAPALAGGAYDDTHSGP